MMIMMLNVKLMIVVVAMHDDDDDDDDDDDHAQFYFVFLVFPIRVYQTKYTETYKNKIAITKQKDRGLVAVTQFNRR